MKDLDIFKDILQYRIQNQKFYNEQMITIRNPEARQMFIQLRDDEMRAVTKLQQISIRLENQDTIVKKIFPSKSVF